MKRGKSQAVYKYLPGMWVSEKNDANRNITAQITGWNHRLMENIYPSYIENEIVRQIRLFASRGGDISSFSLSENNDNFVIVEPACNEGVPDIVGVLSPLVFYCNSCHRAFEIRDAASANSSIWRCPNPECKKTVKQLQMVYSCECGFAEAIRIPYVSGVKEYKYYPNDNPYRMVYRREKSNKIAQFNRWCPDCNTMLTPDNADSGRNYKPFMVSIINLVDTRQGQFYEKGIKAKKTLVAEWFGKLSHEEYIRILENIELAFSDSTGSDAQRQEAENQARAMISMGLLDESKFTQTVNALLGNKNKTINVEGYVASCDQIFFKQANGDPSAYDTWISNLAFKLMQYNTLKYANQIITLDEALQIGLNLGLIDSADKVYTLNSQMGISNVQVSNEIEIINCCYGYTRKISDPSSAKKYLRLKAFDKYRNSNKNLVYSSKLETEGILFEIDRKKIIEWLLINNIIKEEQVPDLLDEYSVKRWFAENVHGDLVSTFGQIDSSEIITATVFSLLHTMAHMFIKTAGELCGLSANSLTEIILVETTSIFIYPQTVQGISLGAISSLFETSYFEFLHQTFINSKSCVFDPICTDRDDTCCSVCTILSDTSCKHFNSNLGRKYLYSLVENEGKPFVGFWEMN